MNTFSVDMGAHSISVHTTENEREFGDRAGCGWFTFANYRHLALEFKRGRRFVRWENGYAEIVRATR